MSRGWVLLGFWAAALATAHAADRKATVGDYGIFEAVGDQARVSMPQVTSGSKLTPEGVRYVERTRWIPARKGVKFGFDYEVDGADQASVEVMILVSHPPIRKPDGSVSRGFKFKESIPVEKGKARAFAGYSLDHDYEIVTGEWKFELWVREGRLLEWTFITTQAGTSASLPLYENKD